MQQEFLGAPYTCQVSVNDVVTFNNPAVCKVKRETCRVNRLPLEKISGKRVVAGELALVRGWFMRNNLDILQESVGIFTTRDEIAVLDFVVENEKQVFVFWVYESGEGCVKKPDIAMRRYAAGVLEKLDSAYNFDCVGRFLCVGGDQIRCMRL